MQRTGFAAALRATYGARPTREPAPDACSMGLHYREHAQRTRATGHTPIDLLTHAEAKQRAAKRREHRHAAGFCVGVVWINELDATTATRQSVLIFEFALHDDDIVWNFVARDDAGPIELSLEEFCRLRAVRLDEAQQALTVFESDDDLGCSRHDLTFRLVRERAEAESKKASPGLVPGGRGALPGKPAALAQYEDAQAHGRKREIREGQQTQAHHFQT